MSSMLALQKKLSVTVYSVPLNLQTFPNQNILWLRLKTENDETEQFDCISVYLTDMS